MEKNTSKSTVTETVKSDRDKRLDSMGIPRSRLVSIPEMLTRLEIASAGAASLQELTDALGGVYDGETLYNGAWSGLSEQITGIEPGECSDYNRRADIITDLFNRQWWEPGNSDKPIEFSNGRTFCDGLTPNTTMVLKEDAEKLSSDIWAVFFPGEKLPANSIQGGLSHQNALQAELEQESQRSTDLAADLERQRTAPNQNQAARSDGWTKHSTKLFNLLPTVIEMAKRERSWPKQEGFVAELMGLFGLTQAEAKALDAVTRPDELRRK